jgi:translocation and assembly module TamB
VKRRIALALAALVLLAAAGFAWLVGTEAGARFVLGRVLDATPVTIEAVNLSGTLAGPLRADALAVEMPGARIEAGQLELDWSPLALLLGRVRLQALRAGELVVRVDRPSEAAGNDATALPAVALPVRLDDLLIERGNVYIGDEPLVTEARLALAGGLIGRRLAVERIDLAAREATVSGHANVSADPDDPWSVLLTWRVGADEAASITGRTQADGRLGRLNLSQSLSGLVEGRVEGTVQGLPRRPSADLRMELGALAETGPWPDVLAGSTASMQLSGSLDKAQVHGRIQVPAIAQGPVELSGSGGWTRAGLEARPLELRFANGGRARISGHLDPAADWALDASLEGETLGWPLGAEAPEVSIPRIRLEARGTSPSYRFVASGSAGYGFLPVSDVEASGDWESSVLRFDSLTLDGPERRLDVTGHGALDFGQERFSYRFDLSGAVQLGALPPMEGSLAGEGDTAGVELDHIRAETLAGVVDGAGHLAWGAERRTDFQATARGIDLSYYRPDFASRLSADISLADAPGEPGLEIAVSRLEGTLRDQPVSGRGRMHLQAGRYRLSELDLAVGSATLTGRGDWGTQVDLDALLEAPSLGELLPSASGGLRARISASGPASAPLVTASATTRDLRLERLEVREATLEADLDLSWKRQSSLSAVGQGITQGGRHWTDARLELAGVLQDHRLAIEAATETLRIGADARGGLADRTWTGEVGEFAVSDATNTLLALRSPVAVSLGTASVRIGEACLEGSVGRICAAGEWGSGNDWKGRTAFEELGVEAITRRLGWPYIARGSISGEVGIEASAGTFTVLEGFVELGPGAVFDPADPGLALHSWSRGRIDLAGDRARAEALVRLDPTETGSLEGRLTLGWNEPDPSLGGGARMEVAALPIISELVPDVTAITGQARSEFELGGTLSAPEITGSLILEDGSAQVPALGLHPQHILARADFIGRRVELSVSAESGGGRMEVGGGIEITPDGRAVGRVRVRGADVLIVNMPEARLFASPDLQFTYRGDELRIVGDLKIPSGQLTGLVNTGAVRPSPDEAIIGEVQDEGPAVVARVRLTVGPDVTVDFRGLSGRLEGEILTIVDPPAEPYGRGELRFIDGSLAVFGQRLEIQRGALVYTGGPLEDPSIDITAVREVQDVRVGARARGSLREPTVTLFSEPPMSRAEALSYLTTGKPISELESGEDANLSRAATSLALAGGSLIAGEVGERIGIDELGFEGDDETGNASLVIGKWLSPQLYVSYGVGLLEAVNVLRMRYRLSRRLSVEVSTSEESAADVIYTIERN